MPTARISLTVNGNINPMRIVELVVQLCMAGHTVTLFVFAIIAAWFAVTMANACLNAPSVPVPYTQLRELPCEEDEPVIWFSSKRHVGRHISRSDTMSATLLRSAAGSQTLQNTSGNGVLANLTFAEDLWTGLSYEKRRGQLFLTVVEPSKCAVRRYFSRIQPLFSEKFLSEEHTTIPMNVEGTTDWTIFTPEQVLAGPCSCIATSGDKTHIAVVYSTTANESSIHTVRMFYPNNLKPFADDLLNEQEEQPDFILPIEEYTNTSAEFRLRGDLNVKSLEWTDENRCLTYSRSGDVVDYRRVCVVQDDKGGYFMVPKGVSKPAWGNLILTHVVNSTGSAYEVPNLVVAVRYSPGVIFVNVEWVKEGGEETVPEKNNTLSKYWETPLLPHWNASCNVVQLAVGGVRLHDRWLKAVSQRGGVMALPFIDDTLVVFDFDKIVSNQSKRCDENEKGIASEGSVAIIPDTSVQGSIYWMLSPPGLRRNLDILYQYKGEAYPPRSQKADISDDEQFISLVTSYAVQVFYKRSSRGLLDLWTEPGEDVEEWKLGWRLPRDGSRVGLGKKLDIIDVQIVKEGERWFLTVLYEKGTVVVYLLEENNHLVRILAAVVNVVFATLATCFVLYFLPSRSSFSSIFLILAPILFLLFFDVFILDTFHTESLHDLSDTPASLLYHFNRYRSCPVPSHPVPNFKSSLKSLLSQQKHLTFRDYPGIWSGPLSALSPAHLTCLGIPFLAVVVPATMLMF